MKLLLQAGIHLIKKVITFVIYGRSVQVFKACTLFYFFSAEFFFSQIFLRGKVFVPQISQIYTDFLHHDFSSSDFTEESEAFLLIGLLTEFRGILAAGQWLAPYICSCCFGHADFADDADFSSWEGFVPQISQIYTDFFHHDFSSSDFTDESEGILVCRITHGFSRNFGRWPMARALYMLLLFFVTQISLMTQIFLRGDYFSHRFHRFTQIFYGISGESLCPVSGGICNDRTGRICENP